MVVNRYACFALVGLSGYNMLIYPKLSIGLSSFLLKSFESPKSKILINELAEYEFSLRRLSIFMTYSDIFEMSSFLLDLFHTSTVICSSNSPSCSLLVIMLCFIATWAWADICPSVCPSRLVQLLFPPKSSSDSLLAKPSLHGIVIKKYVRSSSVSIVAGADPLSLRVFCMVGMPVARPSVRLSSLRKSPSRRFRYLRALSFLAALIASLLMERSGPA